MASKTKNGKKEKRGGTRQGSGAKPKYNEETKTVAFRCPISKVDELKIFIKSKLSEWSVKVSHNVCRVADGQKIVFRQSKIYTNAK